MTLSLSYAPLVIVHLHAAWEKAIKEDGMDTAPHPLQIIRQAFERKDCPVEKGLCHAGSSILRLAESFRKTNGLVLDGVNFAGTRLDYADFRGYRFSGCINFTGASLFRARMDRESFDFLQRREFLCERSKREIILE